MRTINLLPVLILLCILLSLPSVKAQTWAWANSGQSPNAAGNSVCTDLSGNVYIGGAINTVSPATFGTYTVGNLGFLVKYDANGNILWANPVNSGVISVSSDQSGNVYAGAGWSTNNFSLKKYDAAGNLIWTKSAAGPNTNVYKIETDPSGNTYAVGSFNLGTCSFGSYSLTASGNQNVFVVKYDANGNVLWAKGSNGCTSTTYNNGNSIAIDGSGNAYITGYIDSPTISFGTYTLSKSSGDSYLVKYDANGNEQWAKSRPFQGVSVKTDLSGNVYLSETYDLTKFDANGNVIWSTTPVNISNINSVSTDGTSVCISGGFMNSAVFGSHTVTAVPGATWPMFIAKYDLNGNALYATELSGGGDWFKLNSNHMDNSCNLYNTGGFRGSPSNLIVGTTTLNLVGTVNPFVTKLSFSCAAGIKAIPDMRDISLFPNPNNGSFKIRVDSEINDGEMIIFNSLGQKVLNQKIGKGENNVISNGLAKGMYSYLILENKKQIRSGKLSIE